MIVADKLILQGDELTGREWRNLFSKLRYSDADNNVYEPWRVLPHKRQVHLPRGAWFLLPDKIRYQDSRVFPEGEDFYFTGNLGDPKFPGQADAVKRMFEEEQGLIVAQPGFGKTEVALAFFSACETPTLILVHTNDILQQWVDRAEKLVPHASVGVIQGQDYDIGDLTIATVQTFTRRLRTNPEIARKFGCVMLDEAHHAPAGMFDEILSKMPARYRFGFTATTNRADGKHPYMRLVIGPVIYRREFKSKVPVEVYPIKSHNFKYHWRGSWDWRGLINALITDKARNQIIASVAVAEMREGHSTLILSREISHLELIEELMFSMLTQEEMDDPTKGQIDLLTGKLPKEMRDNMLNDFRSGKLTVLLATQLADEALDVPILSRIILTYPGKHDGRIIQQVGRALREHPGKANAIIYDVVDDKVGVLRHQWLRRKQAYSKMKIHVRKLRSK